VSRRRFSFGATAYALAVTMLGTTLPTSLYGLYSERFGFSELMITVIFATYACGVIAALLFFGPFSDAVGRRRMLLPGLAASALSAVAFLLAHGLAPLLIGRLLSGLSAGVFTGTATATLVDLVADENRGRATLVATIANMGGLGLGPLLAGIVSETFGSPLRLVFWIDLALVASAATLVWVMCEPVDTSGPRRLSVQGLSVPDEVRATFIRAAIAAFAGFAVLGLFTAVAPAFVVELGYTSRVTIGLVVCAVFAASTAGQLALERVPGELALPAGCGILILGMAGLGAGLAASSLGLIVTGGVIAGFGQGLTFRGGLTAVNSESPAARRAEVASSFFVVAYVAISIPIVGAGVLAQVVGLKTAGLVFAGFVAALSAVALALLVGRSGRGGSQLRREHADVVGFRRLSQSVDD
jgi:MFS family permease